MEPSSGKCPDKSSGTVSPQLTENDDEQSNNLSANLTQASDSGAINDEDIIKTTTYSINDLQSSSKAGSSIMSSCELQETLQEYEKQTEEQVVIEGVTKTTEEEAKEDFSKTIEDSVVIIAYPSKQRPKQPFIIQPPDQSGSTNNPRPPIPPRPPLPSSAHSPIVPQQNANQQALRSQSEPDSAVTQQPQAPPRVSHGLQAVGVPILIDPFHMYPGSPSYFTPAALYSGVIWAPIPQKIPRNVPNSLAHLLATESFYITQISWFDYFSDMEEFFIVRNKNGECLYFVYETMDYGEYALCESYRAYRLHFLDMYQNEAIFMHRLSGCTSFCCCYPEMLVYAPPGVPVGTVKKKYNFTREEYALLDPDQNRIFKMLGPFCATCCCWTLEADFTIHALDSNETEVGFIRREAGYFRTSTGSELLGLTLPIDMDVRVKALFLGAVFLIVR